MLTKARAEISEQLSGVPTARKPALRRAREDDWLLACDLPLCAGEAEAAAWCDLARENGWTVSQAANGWLLLDRIDLIPTSAELPGPIGGELGALISLLARQRTLAPPDARVIRRLAKSAEESGEALDRECRSLHHAFAVSLRRGEALQNDLPWLCAIARIKEENS